MPTEKIELQMGEEMLSRLDAWREQRGGGSREAAVHSLLDQLLVDQLALNTLRAPTDDEQHIANMIVKGTISPASLAIIAGVAMQKQMDAAETATDET